MGRFLVKRFVFIISVSICILFFAFWAMRMAQNSSSARSTATALSSAQYAARRTGQYISGLAQGYWGTITIRRANYRRVVPVTDLIVGSFPNSLGLLTLSLLLASVVGVPIGLFAARQSHSPLSLGLLTSTLIGISLPSFLIAALLQLFEVIWYRRTGVRIYPVGGFGWDGHLVVPVLVLSARPLAYVARMAHMSFSDVLSEPYIATARSKGLSKGRMVRGHAYPNAAIPILTAAGVSLRFSLSSLPVVEALVGWPGIGAKLIEAIQLGQSDAVAGLALVIGLTIMLVNLGLDVAYRLLDPRLDWQRA